MASVGTPRPVVARVRWVACAAIAWGVAAAGTDAGEPPASAGAAAPFVSLVLRVPRTGADEADASATRDVRWTPVGLPAGRPRRWLVLGAHHDRTCEVSMGSLAVGGYEVAVRPWAYSTWVYVRADTDVVRLRVPEPLAVPVVTTDAATGAVVTGATVRIDDVPSLDPSTVRDPEALWPRIESRRTGSVLRALPGTSAALRVDAPGYAPVLLTAAVDGDAEGDVVLSVPLPRPATVRVVVRGEAPSPRLSALLWSRTGGVGPWNEAVADADLRVRGLPVGPLFLRTRWADGRPPTPEQRVVLAPGASVDLVVDPAADR